MHKNNSEILSRIADVLNTRLPANISDTDKSYTANLLAKGPDSFLKKIGEEATELVMACKDNDTDKIIYETADLWFHCLVALTHYGVRPEQVLAELQRREGVSGLKEKAERTSDSI